MPKMPGGKLPYVKDLYQRAGTFRKKIFNAQNGKKIAQNVANTPNTVRSSGAMQKARNTRMAKSVMAHPYRAGAAGVAGAGMATYVGGGRRGRGVDKMGRGRPTGIYKY